MRRREAGYHAGVDGYEDLSSMMVSPAKVYHCVLEAPSQASGTLKLVAALPRLHGETTRSRGEFNCVPMERRCMEMFVFNDAYRTKAYSIMVSAVTSGASKVAEKPHSGLSCTYHWEDHLRQGSFSGS